MQIMLKYFQNLRPLPQWNWVEVLAMLAALVKNSMGILAEIRLPART